MKGGVPFTPEEREQIIAEIKSLVAALTYEEKEQLYAWVEAAQKARGGVTA